jgi:uncharacterized protein YraI
MKRVLLSLWLVGAGVYAATTLHFAHVVNNPKHESTAPSVSPNPPNVVSAAPVEAALHQSDQPTIVNPAEEESTHAISPEQGTSEVPTVGLALSSVPLEEQPPAPAENAPVPSTLASEYAEYLTVTSAASIRSGPSTSAPVIGTAYAGAQVKVASRRSGWVQIVDPDSRRSGWIYSGFLAPMTANSDTGSAQQLAKDASPMQAVKQKTAVAQHSFPVSKRHSRGRLPQEFVGLPSGEEFVAPRRRGRFGLLAKRRMSREAALPSWESRSSRYRSW